MDWPNFSAWFKTLISQRPPIFQNMWVLEFYTVPPLWPVSTASFVAKVVWFTWPGKSRRDSAVAEADYMTSWNTVFVLCMYIFFFLCVLEKRSVCCVKFAGPCLYVCVSFPKTPQTNTHAHRCIFEREFVYEGPPRK